MVVRRVPHAARFRRMDTDLQGVIYTANARITKRSAVGGAGRQFLGRYEGCRGVCARGEEKGRGLTTSAGSLLLLLAGSGYPDAASCLYG
jgi:hypothetical protein